MSRLVEGEGTSFLRCLGEGVEADAFRSMLARHADHRQPSPTHREDTVRETEAPELKIDADILRESLGALPALPTLAVELLLSLQDETVEVSTLVRCISTDQGLLARLLRIANSPFYRRRGEIVSIDEAVFVLGFRAVRSLALSAAITDSLSRKDLAPGIDIDRFLRHSVAVAVAARALAGVLRQQEDVAFVSGLLHDLGRYALVVCYPERYRKVLSRNGAYADSLADIESATLGLDHTTAGWLLGEAWSLPSVVCAAMRHHHTPGEELGAAVVHVADLLVHALAVDGDLRAVPRLDPAAWRRLSLTQTQLDAVVSKLNQEFEETCNAILS